MAAPEVSGEVISTGLARITRLGPNYATWARVLADNPYQKPALGPRFGPTLCNFVGQPEKIADGGENDHAKEPSDHPKTAGPSNQLVPSGESQRTEGGLTHMLVGGLPRTADQSSDLAPADDNRTPPHEIQAVIKRRGLVRICQSIYSTGVRAGASVFRGVSWHKKNCKWYAKIQVSLGSSHIIALHYMYRSSYSVPPVLKRQCGRP